MQTGATDVEAFIEAAPHHAYAVGAWRVCSEYDVRSAAVILAEREPAVPGERESRLIRDPLGRGAGH